MAKESERRIRRRPISQEEKAVLLAFHKLLKSLCACRGEDLGIRCEIDLSSRYKQLLHAIKEYKGPFDASTANKIHSSVFKPIMRPLKKVRSQVYLTRNSVALAAEILGQAVKRASVPRKDQQSIDKLIRRYGATLAELANATADGFNWTQVILFFQNASLVADQRLESLVSEGNLGSLFTALKSGLTTGLADLLQSGDVTAARQLLLAGARHRELEGALHAKLQQLFSENVSALPRESQTLAMQFLGIRAESAKVEYANPGESPEMRQAAALLLYLFDMHHRSPELQEAFDRYRSVAEQQFNLYLRGIVESKTLFDPRLHEPPEPRISGSQVRIVRPWVEWYKPPDACVVIRGIVEPELEESAR